MTDFKKNKNKRLQQFLLIPGGVLIMTLIILLIVANFRIYQKKQKLDAQIENLKNKIRDIQSKNDELKMGIEEINDNTYIEKVAREELSLQKTGEKVFSFIKEIKQENTDSNKRKNFLQSWLSKLNNFWN